MIFECKIKYADRIAVRGCSERGIASMAQGSR